MVILVELKRGFPPFLNSLMCELMTPIWVRPQWMICLDPVGVSTHPCESVRRLRHCQDDEMWVERKGPMKVGELTEPMVNVISQVTADCLDPGGNIDKEARLV